MDSPDIAGMQIGRRGNIILVGLMGAGKTAVGKVLARLLDKTFVDSDHEIERTTGVRVSLIFEIEGEAGFRAREHKTLADLLVRENLLLATGGGAVLSRDNRELMKANGTVIYLRAPVKALLRRTQHDRTRPLLQVPDPAAKLNELFVQRDPLYRDVADLIVDSGSQSVRTLAAQIHAKLKTLATHSSDVTI